MTTKITGEINVRISAYTSLGKMSTNEDIYQVIYKPVTKTKECNDAAYAYFAVYDGHDGKEAVTFAKKHLHDNIVQQKNFWSDDVETILQAISDGYINTHNQMMKIKSEWPSTNPGHPSSSGTTASVIFIKNGKLYGASIGNSVMTLGYEEENSAEKRWLATSLDMSDNQHQAVNSEGETEPAVGNDLAVCSIPHLFYHTLDINIDRCLILGTDGLWNGIGLDEAVIKVRSIEKEHKKKKSKGASSQTEDYNVSKILVDLAEKKMADQNKVADNMTAITVMFDHPKPLRTEGKKYTKNTSKASSSKKK